MTLNDFPNTKALLELYGASVVSEMESILISGGKYATENLINSLQYTVSVNNTNYEISFDMAPYGVFVDKGRKPGKFPPISNISKWARVKGIPQTAVFPIARKIAKEGIKPFPFIEQSQDKFTNMLIQGISDAMAKDIAIRIQSIH